jgi:hypothetical protein
MVEKMVQQLNSSYWQVVLAIVQQLSCQNNSYFSMISLL